MANDDDDSISWRKLREFSDVDLTQSFVLSWHVDSDTLIVDIDLYLAPGHPFYERPRPAEKVCIRPAVVEFPCCDGLSVAPGDVEEPIEIIEKIGVGAISDLVVSDDDHYELSGEFGTVSVYAERPILRIKGG